MILNGYGRGRTGTLTQINEADFSCNVSIEDERKEKKEALVVLYEDLSKVYSGE